MAYDDKASIRKKKAAALHYITAFIAAQRTWWATSLDPAPPDHREAFVIKFERIVLSIRRRLAIVWPSCGLRVNYLIKKYHLSAAIVCGSAAIVYGSASIMCGSATVVWPSVGIVFAFAIA